MSDVLVVQPDSAQAETLRDICRRIGAELVIVSSTDAAVDAIAVKIPNLILLSTLLLARDEDALMAHLRTLEGASHLQTLTIPQFRAATETAPVRKGGFFRKKQKAPVSVGCEPAVFAEEVVAHLHRAVEIRNRPPAPKPVAVAVATPPEPPVVEVEELEGAPLEPALPESAAVEPEPDWLVPIAQIEEPLAGEPPLPTFVEPISPSSVQPVSIEDDEIDRIARQLGLDVNLIQIGEASPPAVAEDDDAFDFGAALDRARVEAEARHTAELARAEANAEAIREAAIAEARSTAEREARAAVAADLARVQAEAEAMREAAIAEARATAEREARETLDAELALVRSETEVTVAEALNKVKLEAEEAERVRAEAERLRADAQEAFAAELAGVRAEVERSLAAQLDAARVEAERLRAAEANAVRERAAIESQLKSELDRLRSVATQARKADESEAKRAAARIEQLESELASVRAKADERQAAQLKEIRSQIEEMREAAAQHARAAAAEAVASEVARAKAQSNKPALQKLSVIRMQPRVPQSEPVAAQMRPDLKTPVAAVAPESETASAASGDYYSLWQPDPPVSEPPHEPEDVEEEEAAIDFRRYAKWALPFAACLLLVTNTGTAIDTVARLVGSGTEKRPALIVEPVNAEPFIEVVEKRVGRVRVESTPSGAEASIDGRSYGKTPITIPDLGVGTHTLVLKSGTGTIRREVSVKANETTLITEAIFSGWLAIFSPIPVNVVIDGKPVSLTDTGRVMTSPGKHVVELINERFNYRSTETLEVRPGETTAHTASVPTGTVRITAPDGAEVRIDGQPVSGMPEEGVALAIGSHEVSATHPERGERRVAVDVRDGALTEVTLRFDQ